MSLSELLQQAPSLADALEAIREGFPEQSTEEQESWKQTISDMFQDPLRRPNAAALAASIDMQELAPRIFEAYQREEAHSRRVNYVMALGELRYEPARQMIEGLRSHRRLKDAAEHALSYFTQNGHQQSQSESHEET